MGGGRAASRGGRCGRHVRHAAASDGAHGGERTARFRGCGRSPDLRYSSRRRAHSGCQRDRRLVSIARDVVTRSVRIAAPRPPPRSHRSDAPYGLRIHRAPHSLYGPTPAPGRSHRIPSHRILALPPMPRILIIPALGPQPRSSGEHAAGVSIDMRANHEHLGTAVHDPTRTAPPPPLTGILPSRPLRGSLRISRPRSPRHPRAAGLPRPPLFRTPYDRYDTTYLRPRLSSRPLRSNPRPPHLTKTPPPPHPSRPTEQRRSAEASPTPCAHTHPATRPAHLARASLPPTTTGIGPPESCADSCTPAARPPNVAPRLLLSHLASTPRAKLRPPPPHPLP
jgi:hypothetical protein